MDLSQILNNHIADVVRKYPKRFIGLGTLPMQAPELAIEEMKRCKYELGMNYFQYCLSFLYDWYQVLKIDWRLTRHHNYWIKYIYVLSTEIFTSFSSLKKKIIKWYIFIGLPGVQIGSHINDWNLDAQELLPVFAVSDNLWNKNEKYCCFYIFISFLKKFISIRI